MANKFPYHVAIIPDGNRRWAGKNGLYSFEGHKKGFERAIEICDKAREMGIKILTFWAFSTENWQRNEKEVNYLMRLYGIMIDKNLKNALQNQTRIIHLGRKDRINISLKNKISQAEEKTKNFTKYYFCIALDYGGQDEMIRAIKKINPDTASGQNLTQENFGQFLDTKDLPYPEVDLIIRTSSELRTSGFMIYQAAYAEYIFYHKYFPDFSSSDFEQCIKEFQQRQRRFGK